MKKLAEVVFWLVLGTLVLYGLHLFMCDECELERLRGRASHEAWTKEKPR